MVVVVTVPVVELIWETAVVVSSAAPLPPRVLASVARAVELVAIVDAIVVVVMVVVICPAVIVLSVVIVGVVVATVAVMLVEMVPEVER